ncbi:hypothetical protein [Mycobacterium sp. Marseille-P9652]|uniref:hypothetical protein n=1 Tax=Mycobacterium sp. Marseille-P9652 TaxID=2654950 RepID=UPI0018D0ABDC|nr:hypothetical protein [Mycobacterium sp. Marseille-P9652]
MTTIASNAGKSHSVRKRRRHPGGDDTTPNGQGVSELTVGERVRIERDQTRYPTKGTWPQFRGKTGTIIEVNAEIKRPHLTEYAVAFGSVSRRPNGSLAGGDTAWFRVYEVRPLAAVTDGEALTPHPEGDRPQRISGASGRTEKDRRASRRRGDHA